MAKAPASWKGPGTGEEVLDYTLYDGQLSTTNANTALTLFDNTEAGVGIDQSNMPIASSLPSKWQFFMGKTHELDNYIHLKGGDQFNVEIETGETAPGASTELTVCLIGELVRPI